MKKKIAIVTGASGGIGKEIALFFGEKGYLVALIARREAELQAVHEEIKKGGGASEVYPLNVSQSEEVSFAIQKIIQRHAHIDVLFNGAGVLKHGTSEIEDKDLNEVLQINLLGAIYVAKHVALQMKKQKKGYIINMSSAGGKVAPSFAGAYCASKFGLAGFSEALTKEMALYGVKVTTIFPAMVATRMVTDDRKFSASQMIQVSDIVKTVEYLLSLSDNALPTEIILSSLPFLEKISRLTLQAYDLKPVF